MKRFLSLFCLACIVLTAALAQQQTVMVQGVPRQINAKAAQKVMQKSAAATKLDVSKVKFYAGEGSKTSYLIVEWNDGKGAEKLVWGYRWEDEDTATGEQMIKAIAKADPRFYVLVMGGTQYGSAIGGLGFDLNGDTKSELMKVGRNDTTYIKPDENGLVYTNDYDFDSYTATDSTDHWCAGWYNGYFSYWVAKSPDENLGYSGVGATGRKLNDGSVDYWSYSSFAGNQAKSVDYYFYVPEAVPGVALPGEIEMPISDTGMLPVILGATGKEAKTMAWTTLNEKADRDYSIIKTIRSTAAKFNGSVTFTGNKTGLAKVLLTATIDGVKYTSDTCRINVTAPEIPIETLAFENDEMEAGLRQTIQNPLNITPANATYTGVTYSSSNKEVASVNATTGAITTTAAEGETVITATGLYDETVSASFKLTVKCLKPVESIAIEGNTDIVIEERDIYPKPEVKVTPEDADYTAVNYTIENPEIASFYQNNIVAHKAGETTMTITALDGKGAETKVKIIVHEPDRTPFDGYQDGTFLLNEAWFGHENGDMNFLTADNNMMYRVYERENPGEAFGATSCSATIYGGRMYVISKQPADGGDETTKGGGRLVVMDAKTLKKIAGFDAVGNGDGRSVVGVNPNKVYLGTTAGVVTFDADNLTVGEVIEGTQGASLYTGQTGDMLKAYKYVFAIQQNVGTNVIDTETDKLVKTIENKDIQGIAQTPDGKVWLASTNKIERLDPLTLLTDTTVALPEGMTISCSWGAWRPTPFCASRTKNVLYWNGGAGITGNGAAYFRYDPSTDINDIKPLFSLNDLPAATEGKQQISYGSIRYDDRKDELIVMTTQSGYGTSYEHNWIHLVDGTTGELKNTIKLKQYYWFQALPIFPDKFAPEFNDVEATIDARVGEDAITIDLDNKVIDMDNLACNISTVLKDAGDNSIANVELVGNSLTVTPVAAGITKATLTAESNGVVTEHEIEINVAAASGIDNAASARSISCANGRLAINGYKGWQFMVYNTGGQLLNTFMATTATYTAIPKVDNGTFILKGWRNNESITVKIAL